jgi:hypothetical protein
MKLAHGFKSAYYEYPFDKPTEGEPILFWAAKFGRWFDTTYVAGGIDFRWWMPQKNLPIPTEYYDYGT